MTESITVRIADIIGSHLGVSASDGQRLHDKIAPLLQKGTPVILSFEHVDILISAFLNTAVGQLYGEFPESRITKLLSFHDLTEDDCDLIEHVVDNAKVYFSRPRDFDQAWQKEMGDGDEE